MDYANSHALVSTAWMAEHLDAPDVRIVDATYHLPHDERSARAEYTFRHIPGAVFFDIDDICADGSGLPHMLPSPEKFSSRVRKLGLGDGAKIVVYDSNGGYMAAMRVWWMFRVFGHSDVAVLDGGLQKWTGDGHPTEDDTAAPSERHFTARMDNTLVRTIDQMLANVDSSREQVADARSPGRFSGVDHEPRPTERRGHIPGSVNLPFPKLMNPKDNFTLRSAADIKAAFDDAGLDLAKPIAASCGSGVTACVIAFAAYLIGKDDIAVYDGSWAEWGDRNDVPIGP